MTNYILKRLLLMVPTLFLIVLITFVILNLAPGEPGQSQSGQQGMQSKMSVESSESRQIFREQFNLDKPVVFNTRFWLDESKVASLIETVADSRRPLCGDTQAPENCIARQKRPESGEVIDARQQISDYGSYIVPQLLDIARSHSRFDVRFLAAQQLSSNAQRALVDPYSTELTKEQRQYNSKVSKINRKLERWTIDDSNPTEADIRAVLKEKWIPWYQDNRERFQYSTVEKFDIFFTDTRFAKYIGNLISLDFGISHVDQQPVLPTIAKKVKYSLTLSFLSIFLAYIISVPLGVWSAYNQHTVTDQVVSIILFILYSLPPFLTGIMLLEYLTTDPFDFFPTGGFVGDNAEQMTTYEYVKSIAWHLVLPVFCLTYASLAALSRYARTGVLDVIRADYIRTARAKGLPESIVVIKHAVRNGMIPVLTLLGTLLPRLIGGSIVLESIFSIPGMGLYLLDSIQAQDYNALMGILVISSILTLVGILISDISYAIVDPRISFD